MRRRYEKININSDLHRLLDGDDSIGFQRIRLVFKLRARRGLE
jgi:hypothetical protein